MIDIHKVTPESSKFSLMQNRSNQNMQDDVHGFDEKEKDLRMK